MVKGAAEALGIKAMLHDMGIPREIKVNVHTDASAAFGIVHRRGMGRIRHIEVAQLWLQSCVADGKVRVHKIPTRENLADALTKPSKSADLEKHMTATGQRIAAGRHEKMPEVQK